MQPLWQRVIHFFERQHALLSGVYYLAGISALVLGGFTWLIGFANQSDKSLTRPAEPPGFGWVPDSVSTFVLQHRWPISAVSGLIIVTIVLITMASERRR